jgi:hypothetical protein
MFSVSFNLFWNGFILLVDDASKALCIITFTLLGCDGNCIY